MRPLMRPLSVAVLALLGSVAIGAASAATVKHDANWHATHDQVICCPRACPTSVGCK